MQEILSKLTQDLIRIPSVTWDTEHIHKIVDFVKDMFSWFDNVFIDVVEKNDVPSLIIKNFDGLRWDICLNGHLDVVPASEDGQFEPKIVDGKIYGRWSVDMKWSISTIIQVMKDVLEAWVETKVLLLLTCDEEVWWSNWAWYCAELWYGADAILTPDAEWLHRIITAGKWIYNVQVSVPGTAGHSAYPWKAKNAIEQTILLYRDLKEQVEEEVELMESDHRWTSVQLTVLHAWKAYNAIPWEATATFNIRHTESYSETLLKNLCKNVFKKYDAEIIEEVYGWLVFTDQDDPIIQSYKIASDAVTWNDLGFEKMHGATDAKWFWDTDAVCILHGTQWANLHAKDEYVEIESLEILYNITKKFVFDFSS